MALVPGPLSSWRPPAGWSEGHSKVRNRPREAGLTPEPHWLDPLPPRPEPKESGGRRLPEAPHPCPSPEPTGNGLSQRAEDKTGVTCENGWQTIKAALSAAGRAAQSHSAPPCQDAQSWQAAGAAPARGRRNPARARGLVSPSDDSLSSASRGRGQAREEAPLRRDPWGPQDRVHREPQRVALLGVGRRRCKEFS